jgi:hypothetical protein
MGPAGDRDANDPRLCFARNKYGWKPNQQAPNRARSVIFRWLRPPIAGEPSVETNLAFAVRATWVGRKPCLISHHLPVVADIK